MYFAYLLHHSTEDWSIPSGGTTNEIVQQSMTKWLTGPKHPGLIILEHELYTQTVQAFISAYPLIKSNGWKTMSLAQIDGDGVYQNADSSTSSVTPVVGILADPSEDQSSSLSSSSSTSSSGTTFPSPTPSKTPTNLTGSNSASSTPSGEATPGTSLKQNSGALSLPASVLVTGLLAVLSTVTLC